MDELSNMKAIIRSMLISEPTQQMTVREIARRHKAEEGKPIPYTKLGFDSLEHFLKSIPDTAKLLPILQDPATTPETQTSKISGNGDGAVLTPIINKEVSHIQSMILRQRQPKSKGRLRIRPAPSPSNYVRPSASQTFSHSLWNYSRKPAYASDYGQVCGGYGQQQAPPYPFKWNFPSNTSNSRTQNSGCAGTSKSQTKISSYAGTCSPQSMKVKTEEFFLPPPVTQKLLQIVRDDQGQSIQKFEASVGKLHPHITGIFPNIEDLIRSLKSVDIISGRVYIAEETASGGSEHAPSASERAGHRELQSSMKIIPAGMEMDSDEDKIFNNFTEAVSAEVEDKLPASGNRVHGMSDILKKRLTEVLHCYPSGIWCSMLPDFFQKLHQVKLELHGSGFTSVIEMLKSCPELFVCVQDNGNWKVCNAKGYWADPESISDKIKENIRQLLDDNPNGVHIDKFADLYEAVYMQRFDHIEMRFGNIDDLFLSINNTLIKMKRQGNRFMIFPLPKAEVIKVAEPAVISTAPAVHGESGILRLIPSDCVRPDYIFPKLVMPEGIKPDSYLNLLIAAVSNLDNFYVHIQENANSNALDDLTDNMLLFYQAHQQKYRVPPEAIVPGIICVTVTYGEYCRCIISSEKDSGEVTVIPIDYGCTAPAKKSGLMFLHKDFAQLPPQAVSCRCANLQPPFNEKAFKRRAAMRFLELVKDKALSGHVAQYDKQRNFLAVSLIDTTGEDDVHINDVLCSEGLASFRVDALITGLPMVQHCIKWKPPSQSQSMEEPKPAPLEHAHVKTQHQIDEPKHPQQGDQAKLPQQFEVPKWSGQVKEVETPRPFMSPPPGFNELPKLQVRSNLARARDPPDTRLFPDLAQLLSVTHLTQGKPAYHDPSETTLVPSLASLQESYKVQELKASYAEHGGSSLTTGARSWQELEGPGTVELLSLDEQQSATTTNESHQNSTENQTFTENPGDCSGVRAVDAEQKPAIPSVELQKFRHSLVRPNSRPVTFDLPRTVQVEFSSFEDLKPKDPILPSPPPRHELLGSPINFIRSPSIPFSEQNYNFSSISTFQAIPPLQYEMPNSVQTYPRGMQNLFLPPFRFGINPPGLPPLPVHAFNPQMYGSPFINNGMTFFSPRLRPPHYQEPYQSFQQFVGACPSNPVNQPAMSSPSYDWNGQKPVFFQDYKSMEPKKLTVPPKKILEIRSPTSLEVQNIPQAANLSNEVKESLATSSNPEQANSDLSAGNASNINASKSALQSDCADSSFDERPNVFLQSLLRMKNDLVDEGNCPTDHETRAREISHTIDMTSDEMEQDSLDEEEQDDDNLEDLEVSLNSPKEGCKIDIADNVEDSDSDSELDYERDESLMEADSLGEYEDSEVRPKSSTPLAPAEREMNGSLEQQHTNSEAMEHSILAGQVVSGPNSKNATVVPKQRTVSRKQRRFISTIDVAGKPLHVFWIEGHPYLEVELLLSIGKLRTPVALRVVKTKSINKKLYELRAKTNPEIFDEMAELGICNVNHMISANSKILLVKLYDVSELLSSINVSDASYMKELHSQVYLHSIG